MHKQTEMLKHVLGEAQNIVNKFPAADLDAMRSKVSIAHVYRLSRQSQVHEIQSRSKIQTELEYDKLIYENHGACEWAHRSIAFDFCMQAFRSRPTM